MLIKKLLFVSIPRKKKNRSINLGTKATVNKKSLTVNNANKEQEQKCSKTQGRFAFDLSLFILIPFGFLSMSGFLTVCFFLAQSLNTHEQIKSETLTSLRDYLNERITKTNNNSKISFNSSEPLDSKIKIIAKELEHIKLYEKELNSRMDILNTILSDTLDIQNPIEFILDSSETKNKGKQKLGMGGGIPKAPSIKQFYTHLSRGISSTEKPLSENLAERIDETIEEFALIPIGVPVAGAVSSNYGYRQGDNSVSSSFHQGIDISTLSGSRVQATGDGTVIEAEWDNDYGFLIRIDHKNGLETIYGHLGKLLVKEGEKVCRGQRIALSGNTGRSTGPHVHYEIRVDGIAKDPSPLIDLKRILRILS